MNQNYIWRWDTAITIATACAQPKANFHQSTFHGLTLALQTIAKRSDKFTPTLNEAGQIQLWILERMNQATTLGEIASQLVVHFPSHFTNEQQALAHLGNLAQQYSK